MNPLKPTPIPWQVRQPADGADDCDIIARPAKPGETAVVVAYHVRAADADSIVRAANACGALRTVNQPATEHSQRCLATQAAFALADPKCGIAQRIDEIAKRQAPNPLREICSQLCEMLEVVFADYADEMQKVDQRFEQTQCEDIQEMLATANRILKETKA